MRSFAHKRKTVPVVVIVVTRVYHRLMCLTVSGEICAREGLRLRDREAPRERGSKGFCVTARNIELGRAVVVVVVAK